MRLAGDVARDVTRGSRRYKADPGGEVDASGRDVEFLEGQGFESIDADGNTLSGLTAAELREQADQRGITIPPRATKAQLVAALSE